MSALRSLVVVLLVAAFAGLVPVAGAQEPIPVNVYASLAPTSLPSTGGTATISALVTSGGAVASISAEVGGTDGSYQAIELTPTGGTAGAYEASLAVPANYADSTVSYQVTVRVLTEDGVSGEAYAGEVTVDAAPQFDEKPAVSDVAVTPRALPASGGTVTLAATATDNRSIGEVHATLTGPDGTTQDVVLEPISATRFEGTVALPANATTTARSYAVAVTATDDIGQPDTADGGTITVAAAPPPAATGRLVVVPGALGFGRVPIGHSALLGVLVVNIGKPGSGPITATVATTPGSAFAVTNPKATISVRPGALAFAGVRFTPTAAGPQKGTLTLTRADGGQPGLAVRLTGAGAARVRR